VKLVAHFTDFLKDTVNLNQDRIDTLEDRVGTIEDFLENSDYEAPIRSFSKQGSWAHKTIIRPVGDRDEFDADFLLRLEPNAAWNASPARYLREVRAAFRRQQAVDEVLALAGGEHVDVGAADPQEGPDLVPFVGSHVRLPPSERGTAGG
jgi:hypothetical protein